MEEEAEGLRSKAEAAKEELDKLADLQTLRAEVAFNSALAGGWLGGRAAVAEWCASAWRRMPCGLPRRAACPAGMAAVGVAAALCYVGKQCCGWVCFPRPPAVEHRPPLSLALHLAPLTGFASTFIRLQTSIARQTSLLRS